jgi:hypothetical protein
MKHNFYSGLIIIIAVIGLFAEKGVLVENQAMELTTPDGTIILLEQDSTWHFKDPNKKEIERDFTVPLSGGRFVLIEKDMHWGFVNKEIVYESDLLSSDSVVASGHSINNDISTATNAAQKQALIEATIKTKQALKKFKIDQNKIADCVKNGEKAVDKKENFKQGLGWEISIKIVINREELLSISDCAKKVATDTKNKKK